MKLRFLVAFMAAAVSAVIVAALTLRFGGIPAHAIEPRDFRILSRCFSGPREGFILLLVVAGIFSSPFLLIAGFAFYALSKRSRLSLPRELALATVLGGMPGAILTAAESLGQRSIFQPNALGAVFAGVVGGAVAALVLHGVRKRLDLGGAV